MKRTKERRLISHTDGSDNNDWSAAGRTGWVGAMVGWQLSGEDDRHGL